MSTGLLNGNFEFKTVNGKIDKTHAVCKHCRKEFKYHKSTTSLSYHMESKHAFASKPTGRDLSAQNSGESLSQTTLSQYCDKAKPIDSAKSSAITKGIAKWIAQSGRPINLAEDEGLQEVIRIASNCSTYQLPSRMTISDRIDSLYDVQKETIVKILADVPYIALTGDYWTSVANQSYLGVTAHFIDHQWMLHSYALNVRHVEDRHLAENCAQHFLGVANAWSINEKVTTFATDNARNVTAAVARTPFVNVVCQAHTLQLAVNNAITAVGIDTTLAKCRKIVGHFKHSPANTMELHAQQALAELDEEVLVQDVSTRWNSILAMLERLLKHKEAILATLDEPTHKHKLARPTDAEWEKLRAVSQLLQPCRDATELLGGEKYVSCSTVLPTFAKLIQHLSVSDDDPAYVSRFKNAMITDVKRRLNALAYKSVWFFVACLLDPRFKHKTFNFAEDDGEEDDRTTKAWETLADDVQKLQNLSQQPTAGRNDNRPPARKKQRVLTLSDSEDEDVVQDDEIRRYRDEPKCASDCDPLKWWPLHATKYPLLSQIAKKYLSTPATTVPSERLFSAAGYIVNKRRASLLPENVDKLTCLHNWLNN